MQKNRLDAQEARWPSGRALDSRTRGGGFDPHSGHHVVSLSIKKDVIISMGFAV